MHVFTSIRTKYWYFFSNLCDWLINVNLVWLIKASYDINLELNVKWFTYELKRFQPKKHQRLALGAWLKLLSGRVHAAIDLCIVARQIPKSPPTFDQFSVVMLMEVEFFYGWTWYLSHLSLFSFFQELVTLVWYRLSQWVQGICELARTISPFLWFKV